MSRWWRAAVALPVAASLPYWLPASVIALRVRIFDLVNGDTGLPTPSDRLPIGEFRYLYGHPAANGRSAGAALSDLFWYWLSPGAQVHQEHLEPGPRYDDVAKTTRRLLARLDRPAWAELVARCTHRIADELDAGGRRVRWVRLRDVMMPIWAEVYYELVFGEPCPRAARDLITGNADDVVSSLKCTRLRHMRRRNRLTAYLRDRIATNPPPERLPGTLSPDEQAYYLQGTFFNTAVVQMSEAMAHLLLAIATHPAVQDRLTADPFDDAYLDRVIDETLWQYPLFGIAHRITTAEIPGGEDRAAVPAGSVLLFDYTRYQQGDGRFDPDRWLDPHTRPQHYIPFGIPANRPCPARGFASMTMRVCAREMLRRYRIDSSVAHTRSLPNRGPCVFTSRPATRPATAALRLLRWRDRWEAVPRSVIQLVLGSWMVLDARRLRLCTNYFAGREVDAR
ncbi:cytochrome P450 [Nocardia sp. NPDC051570]|uniref:cytochrome P450 n=1 Tax=Nocardia sp. NPDC051570 TaxID=3364324 RepID=UPI00378D8A9C